MATKELIVMCGISGSGKTTWASKHAKRLEYDNFTVANISRDKIREEFRGDSEEYFTNEKEVFKEFVRQINESFEIGFDYVIADATHLNKNSRQKLLSRLLPEAGTNLRFVVLKTPLHKAIVRQWSRTGFERVSKNVVTDMHERFSAPTKDEKYAFANVYITEVEG